MSARMGSTCRVRHGKFFRRLIEFSQPEEIDKIIERYEKDQRNTEANYIDIVLASEGALTYQEVLTMPVDSLGLVVERINHKIEVQENAIKAARNKR